ncbi:nitronate monooxygenase [Pseudomonas sp. NPDC007930]|uniref:NAD(P)H-dependent flavin oxidoreductase n=1 Tax=Pseudomonas sp. NPDC007930 TaxID=3364417 RepID=UPI0036E41D91
MTRPGLLELLQITHPIIQAPMVGVSTPALAAAVSNAGGLGSLGLGASTPAQARAMIEATRALTPLPFNVNLFCHAPVRFDQARNAAWLAHLGELFAELGGQPPQALKEIYTSFLADGAMLEMLLEVKPAVVSFHFGVPPQAWVQRLNAAGIVTLGCATQLHEAEQLAAAGVRAIVAQGAEAGGHRGVFDDAPGQDPQLGLIPLLRLLARRIELPLIAAGGLMDGASIAAALQLGASAVQLGTAFILCPESSASAAHREALLGERGLATRITSSVSGRPARGLANRLYLEHPGSALPLPAEYPLAYDAGKALHALAQQRGSSAFAAEWAGQGAPLARAMPAGALLAVLVEELEQAVG